MDSPSKKSTSKIILPLLILMGIGACIYFGKSFFEKSLFTMMEVPKFELMDQNGKIVTDKDMLGKVYVVEFFYARCPTICPIMNNNLKFVDQAIKSKDFGIISISIDPENDTPEFLKAHAKKLGVTNPNWHFLTGNRDYIGDLANEFDIYVGDKDDQSESLNHSGMLALVDKEGNVRCRFGKDGMPILYYSGLNYDDQEGKNASLKGKFQPDRKLLIEDIQKLLEE